jgi:hypothetical protein
MKLLGKKNSSGREAVNGEPFSSFLLPGVKLFLSPQSRGKLIVFE